MLVRALEEVLGLCGELATAASRWRPRGGSGRVARAGEGQREAKERWRRFRATRGVLAGRRWRGGGGPEWWATRQYAGGEREQRGKLGKKTGT